AGGDDFSVRMANAKSALTAEGARKALADTGWQSLRRDQNGDPTGRAWTEAGEIDRYGHNHGWRVSYHAVDQIQELADRIQALLSTGWRRVVVVTDHGWLMLPDP